MKNDLSNSGRQRFWENHIAQCTASGLSQSEYCRSNKISIKSFYYWKRRSKGCGAPVLVEVPIPKSFPLPPSYPQLCLVIGRYRIEMGRGFDPEDLERVVRTLDRI
jgi:hypothetical protein